MKRASDATIQRRTATAQRKGIYLGNIIMALIPVVNGFYYFGVRISEIPDSDFTNSRTTVSVIPGHSGDGWSLCCCHSSWGMISGFSAGVNPGLALFRRMLSPFSSMRWALWMMLSRIASAMVGSPII